MFRNSMSLFSYLVGGRWTFKFDKCLTLIGFTVPCCGLFTHISFPVFGFSFFFIYLLVFGAFVMLERRRHWNFDLSKPDYRITIEYRTLIRLFMIIIHDRMIILLSRHIHMMHIAVISEIISYMSIWGCLVKSRSRWAEVEEKGSGM